LYVFKTGSALFALDIVAILSIAFFLTDAFYLSIYFMANHDKKLEHEDKGQPFPDAVTQDGNTLPAYQEGTADQTGETYDPYGETPKLGMVRVRGILILVIQAKGKDMAANIMWG
jgi:hypothetical protein